LGGDNSLTTRFLRGDAADQVFAELDAGGDVEGWLLADRLGSTGVLANNSEVLDVITYDPFGNIVSQSNAFEAPLFLFTGRQWDGDIGLQYNRERWYDPTTGRWLSQDPTRFEAGDSNLYRYVHNAPTGYGDPSGTTGFRDYLNGYRNLLPEVKAEVDGIRAKMTVETERIPPQLNGGGPDARYSVYYRPTSAPAWLGRNFVESFELSGGASDDVLNVAAFKFYQRNVYYSPENIYKRAVAEATFGSLLMQPRGTTQADLVAEEREWQRQLTAQRANEYLERYSLNIGPITLQNQTEAQRLQTIRLNRMMQNAALDSAPQGSAATTLGAIVQFAAQTALAFTPIPNTIHFFNAVARGDSLAAVESFAFLAFDVAGLALTGLGNTLKLVRGVKMGERIAEVASPLSQALRGPAERFVLAQGRLNLSRAAMRELPEATGPFANNIRRARELAERQVQSAEQGFAAARTALDHQLTPLAVIERTCFAAGTPLLTPKGAKLIEEFKEGDLVLSRSEVDPNGPVLPKVVEEVFVRVAPLWDVWVSGHRIQTTAEHPFYVLERGWIPAKELAPGDQLLSHDRQRIRVESVSDSGEVATVYNLRVSEFSTYFVGSREWGFSVWAHNTCTLAIEAYEGGFALRNTVTRELVQAGNSNTILRFTNRQEAVNWVFRNGVTAPTHTVLPVLNAAAEAEILNALPQYVRGAGGIADNAHGVLAVTVRGETRLYRIGSGGPNIAEGFAQNLAPANVHQLEIAGFTAQNFQHVEGSASSLIRHLEASGQSVSNARLYLNVDALCGGTEGCFANLSNMLPAGTRMEVFGTVTQAGRRQAMSLGTFGR
jgi:RHS repeat-associated protein